MIPAVLFLFMGMAAGYGQPFRPQYHFSPLKNWTNDPNGLVYFAREYHLFFQYNPLGDVWGHMSWGHAVSPDLIHWKELPVAIPEENGVMIFTGSTVIDEHNTTGFCTGSKPCMVAIYTGYTAAANGRPAIQAQYLAYSNDRGRTWTKYSGNPVLNLNLADFRDPGVFWSRQSNRWIMTVSLPDLHRVRFYGSSDLKEWDRLSEFGPEGTTAGVWECPELFELPVDGNPQNTRWVLKVGLNPGGVQGGSGEQYFIGRFDGARFTNDNPPALSLWTDYGKDCYCALTFNHLPSSHAPVMLGWMNNWQYADKLPTNPWRGQMTVPRELALRTFPEGVRLVQQPVRQLEQIRKKAATRLDALSFEVHASLNLNGDTEAGWNLGYKDGTYLRIGYNSDLQELFVDRTHSGLVAFSDAFPARTGAPLRLSGGRLDLLILVDRNSTEVFAEGGRIAMTNLVFPSAAPANITFYSAGNARAGHMAIWPLDSVWRRN